MEGFDERRWRADLIVLRLPGEAPRRVTVQADNRIELTPAAWQTRLEWFREHGEMNDKTPRDWCNVHIGQPAVHDGRVDAGLLA